MFYARDDIIDLFEKGILPYKDNAFKTKEKKTEEESEKNELEKIKDGYKSFIKYIEDESKGISYELFKKYFYSSVPSALVKQLYETKKKNNNYKLVSVIKSGLSDLKDEIKEMSKEEIENKKADKILKNIEEILHFNQLEQQKGEGFKILTPNQMLSRLPITLAQLKAGNNSEKLKNEIRQLLYSLYRSRKLTKQFYKSLIDII